MIVRSLYTVLWDGMCRIGDRTDTEYMMDG
jgi:hypothetical protein